MKKSLVMLILLILIFACKKENPPIKEDKYLTFFMAGQTEGLGVKLVDFEPDKQLSYGSNGNAASLNLDMNNDSIDDFELRYSWWSQGRWYNQYLRIIPIGNNSICVSDTLNVVDDPYAEGLVNGDSIGSNSNWSNSTSYLYSYHKSYQRYYDPDTIIWYESSTGYWYDRDNIYVGVKVIKDDKEFFGWIDMKGRIVRRYAVTRSY